MPYEKQSSNKLRKRIASMTEELERRNNTQKGNQELVNLVFEIAQTSYLMDRVANKRARYFKDGTQERHMGQVAETLARAGYRIHKVGMSWRVLTPTSVRYKIEE